CHVMAHESFEDAETAGIMNAQFVCIKVDREERPDLDSVYMSAVGALTGHGGWPLSVFLTPDLQPFYGGTYFPPEPRHGLPGFPQLLRAVADAWRDRRPEIARAGAQVTAQLVNQSRATAPEGAFGIGTLTSATHSLIGQYDWKNGGWGTAPKFPQPMAIEFLLRRHLASDTEALAPAVHALRAMARGGMWDVIGGGFARYSTDDTWHVPHFEKMLYDNALLARAYLHAWQVTGEASFRRVVDQALTFVAREMTTPEGAFLSSLDADSEGVEGRYYVWSLDELRTVLGENTSLFAEAYGVTEGGTWEGTNVLQRSADDATLAARHGMSPDDISEALERSRARLFVARGDRVRPAADDTVLTAWNGLMLSSFAEAARVFANQAYLDAATRNANFLLSALRPGGHLQRTWRNGVAGQPAYLDDYASLILGLLDLYQTDFDNRWFAAAKVLAEEMLTRFTDPAGGFFDTPDSAEQLMLRPKDLQDNAVPSGSALAVEALLTLASLTGSREWRRLAGRALELVSDLVMSYPTAFGRWLCAADLALGDEIEVAIVGDPVDRRTRALVAEIRAAWRPSLVVALSSAPLPSGAPDLLADRPMVAGQPTAYVCEGSTCRQPVTTPDDLRVQLR
ncbi:MAG TPA: thioredoxin domain-containing protein, partial [Clostridia bacterium]|nr:thioredoxin domain-containing protein [Clostridia bacterium]